MGPLNSAAPPHTASITLKNSAMPKPYPLPNDARATLEELLEIESPEGWSQCLRDILEAAQQQTKYPRSWKDLDFELYCLEKMVKAVRKMILTK